jgi:hypothetical protein
MDNDIRDLLAEDVFDPFGDEEENELEDVIGTSLAQEENSESEDELATDVAKEAPVLPAEERIRNLLEKMPGQKRLMLRLIAYCEEQKSGAEMDEYTEKLKEDCYSVYSPVVFRELLEDAGAIEYIPDESKDEAEEGRENPEAHGDSGQLDTGKTSTQTCERTEKITSGANKEDASACMQPSEVFAQGGVLIPIDEEKVQHESLVEDGQELTLDYLEIEETKPGFWVATAAGLDAVAQLDDFGSTVELLQKEPRYLDIYHQILDFCAHEELGRSSKEIDNLVNDSPLLQEPRRYSGYFVSRLERQGALEWHSGWCITDAGKAVLEKDTAEAQKEECYA